ncbi:hypothetical protein ACQ4M4_18980 [Leptolyngbya sp. AN02str]|uniref:hypothetical protein n=1 Tax=Leptolyngbya sp. AN02str TaxID=3423363 RepID=UPI003D31C495
MHTDRGSVSPSKATHQLSSRHRVWLFGTSAWIVGIIDRTLATVLTGELTIAHGVQLGLAIAFFIGWLYLKPANVLGSLINRSEEVAPAKFEIAEVMTDIQPERDTATTGEAAKD